MNKPTLIDRALRLANNLKAIADHMDPVIPTQADAQIIFDLIELAGRAAPASPLGALTGRLTNKDPSS